MGILDRALRRMKPAGPTFDPDQTLREIEATDCVLVAAGEEVELAGPEEAVTKWTPVVREHHREFRKALDRVPGYRKVNNPPLGERWIVSTTTDDDGSLRMRLVEPAPEPGPVVDAFEAFKVGDDLWVQWRNPDGSLSVKRWK